MFWILLGRHKKQAEQNTHKVNSSRFVCMLVLKKLTSTPHRITWRSCPPHTDFIASSTAGTTMLNLVFSNTPTTPFTSTSLTVLPSPLGYCAMHIRTSTILQPLYLIHTSYRLSGLLVFEFITVYALFTVVSSFSFAD
jgi:hypothetical protein